MAKQLQLRRGTTAEHASFTGAVGEVTVDSDKDTLVVHDAYQVGGFPMLREDLNNLANSSVGVAKIANGSANQYLKTNGAGTAVEWSTLDTQDFPSGTIVNIDNSHAIGRFNQSVVDNSNNLNYTHMNGYNWTYTTREANSKILIQFAFTVQNTTSHYYFNMKYGGTGGVWLSDSGSDGLWANHSDTSSEYWTVSGNIVHAPNVAAGTTITYTPYHAHWGAKNVNVNNYGNGNGAGSATPVLIWEIKA